MTDTYTPQQLLDSAGTGDFLMLEAETVVGVDAEEAAALIEPFLTSSGVPTSRLINTTGPLAGGGDLSADRTLTVGDASDTAKGVVELATNAEVATGTDTARAVTPAGAASHYAPATPTVGTALSTSGTINLDLSTLNGTYQTITLTGNPTFTTSNLAAGRTVTVILAAGGSSRTLAFPAWIFVGAAAPTTLASGKTGVFTVTATSTTDASCVATYAAQP